MNWFSKLRLRFRALFQKEKLDAQMDDEMRSHIEMQAQENMDAGMKPDEARYAAIRQFGSVESIKETCRDQRGLPWLETLWQDIRYGARQLRKDRGFTAVAVLTLALGIGANTAIFTLTNALLLRPLPGVEKPDELVLVGRTQNGSGFDAFSYPDYADLRDLNSVFSGLAAYRATDLVLTVGRADETTPSIAGALVSHQYFSLLGARALKGRMFTPQDENGPGADHVCVISYGLWKRSFGSNPRIVGESIKLNGHSFTIIGVMNEDFSGTEASQRVDAWLPITMYAQADPFSPRSDSNNAILSGSDFSAA